MKKNELNHLGLLMINNLTRNPLAKLMLKQASSIGKQGLKMMAVATLTGPQLLSRVQ